MADTTSTTQFKADISQLKSAMQQAQRQVKLANSEFKAATSGMDDWSDSADGLKAKLKQLDSTLKSQKTQLSLLESEYEKTKTVYGENSAAADKVKIAINNMKASIANTEKQIDSYTQELSDCENGTGKFADEVDDLDESVENAGDGFTVFKGVLSDLISNVVTWAVSELKDLAAEVMEVGSNFEKSMSNVGALSGATEEELKLLSDTAKEFGANTQFSATEAADALSYMALAGWDAETSCEALSGVLDLAASSGMDLAEASDMVTDYMSAFSMEASESSYFADLLSYAQANANTTAEGLGQAFKNCAANMNSSGQSIETTTALLSSMANQGLKGSEAGTALTAVMRDMTKKMENGKIAIGDVSVEVMNADGDFRDLIDILYDVSDAVDGMGDAERSTALYTTFTKDSIKGLNLILNAGLDNVSSFEKALHECDGTAAEMAKTMNDNLSGDITALNSKLEGIKITIYESMTPALRDAVKQISEVLDTVDWEEKGEQLGRIAVKAVEFFTKVLQNAEGVKSVLQAVGTALGTAFVVSKVLTFASTIISLYKTFQTLKAVTEAATTAQLLLNAAEAASPIGLVTAAAAGLAAGLIYLASKSKSYQSQIETLTDWEQIEINKVWELKNAYEEVTAARDDSIDSINTEYDYYNQLAEELDTLVDENGRVEEADRDRANFIMTTLNDALGTEMELVDGLIENYNSEKQAIEDLIETKKAQAILSASEDAYTQAIQNQNDALQAYMSSQGVYKQNVSELSDLESQYNKIKNMTATEYANANDLIVSETTAAEMLANEQINLQNKIAGTKGAIVESKTAMIQAEKTYEDYQTTIKNYEGLSSAIISGDQEKIKTSLAELQYNFKTAETSTRESLEQQVVDFEENYEALKDAIDKNTPGVTQEMVDQAQSMVKAAKDELNKLPGEAETAANNTADSFSTTLGSTGNKAKTKAGTNALRDSAKEGFDGGDKEAETAGNNMSLGYMAGIEYYAPRVNSTAESVGTGAVSSLNKGQESNSPSEATKRSGENFGQGFINGMNNKTNSVWTTAYNLAKTALNALKSGQQEGSPSKLTFQSGKYFTQGYINGIASQQTNLVNTVKSLVTAAVKEAAKVTNYGFSEAGSNVADMLADKLTAKTTYMVNKMTYKNEKEIAKFDKEITKLNAQSAKATTKFEKEKAKDSAQIQADSNKTIANLEQMKKIATTKAEKDRITKEIAAEKARAKKVIAASDASWDKKIDAEKKKYEKLIATQEKYKTAYQDASTEMISEFSEAVNDYSSKAQDLINSTLNGIGDKFQTKYDELIGKQTTLTNKLKSAGDLFSISGAGVMTVNDIQEQTKQIKEYATKLQQIKNKVSADLFDEIASYDMKEGNAFMDRLLALSDADLKAYSDAYDEKMATAETLAEKTYKKDIDKVAEDYQTELNKALADLPKQLEELGSQSMKGFVEGLTKNTDYMSTEVKTFIKSMVDNFKKDLKIASPSKVMEEIGDFTGEGLVEGLKGTIASVKKTASDMAQSLSKPLDTVKTDIGSLKASVSGNEASVGSTTVNNYYDLVQNNTSPKSLSALETYQARRQQLAMLKAMT